MAVTFGGAALFGRSVSVTHVTNPNAAQLAAYFGVDNVQTLTGGTRGRLFKVTGCLAGLTPADVAAAELQLLSYGDGIARTLVDSAGVSWANVVFQRNYARTSQFMRGTLGGWLLAYEATFNGLA